MHDELLGNAAPFIGEKFGHPNHDVILQSNSTEVTYNCVLATPFRTGDRSFTVLFSWRSRYDDDIAFLQLGRPLPHISRLPFLLMLSDAPANGNEWPSLGSDTALAGDHSHYTTPTSRMWHLEAPPKVKAMSKAKQDPPKDHPKAKAKQGPPKVKAKQAKSKAKAKKAKVEAKLGAKARTVKTIEAKVKKAKKAEKTKKRK